MKILVVCQHYWPEPYPLPDVCEELVRRGHQVHVITGVPNYPMGKTYPEYTGGRNRKQEHNGVQITRTFTIARRHNAVFRLLNYYSYAISSSFYARRLAEEYDVVFTNQTSPAMMSSAAFAYAKKRGKKVVLYCMDLWPACLAAGGIAEHSPIYRFFHKVSGNIYRRVDRLFITSKMFRNYLEETHTVQAERIAWLPQYADTRFEAMPPAATKGDEINLMFAGNIGAAQSLDTVLEAARLLQNEFSLLRWHIVGDGSELERLKKSAAEKGLFSVLFYGRKAAEEMPAFYARADAMLVTLTADPFISLTLPGKVQTYMAAGKPILGAADGEIPRTIQEAECGFCARAEDAQGLAEMVRAFIQTGDKERLGQNAKRYYDAHFTREHFMDMLEEELRIHAAGSC